MNNNNSREAFGAAVETKSFDFNHMAIMSVRIGCKPDGDGTIGFGDGGRTVFELSLSSGAIEINSTPESVSIKLGGNSEAHGLLQCLRFAVAELESKLKEG